MDYLSFLSVIIIVVPFYVLIFGWSIYLAMKFNVYEKLIFQNIVELSNITNINVIEKIKAAIAANDYQFLQAQFWKIFK